jgi:hypothetical protein
VPPHVLVTWQARYLISPWDGQNLKALAQIEYEPPEWLQDMLEDQKKREKKRRGKKYLSGKDIRRQLERSQKR